MVGDTALCYFSTIVNTAVTSFVRGHPTAILDRHAIRRTTGGHTVSLLVGPIGAGGETWRRWAGGTRRTVVVASFSLRTATAAIGQRIGSCSDGALSYLRFLAEDEIPQLEITRDRILDALTITPLGAHP